jgi:protein-ribulosamine 3-kinase
MTQKYPDSKSQAQWPSNKLLSDSCRVPVEQAVSQYLGRKWQVRDVRDFADFASHPALIMSDGLFAVFAKLSEATNGLEQFQLEQAGLKLLTERSGVLTPTSINNIAVEGGWIMLLEAVQAVDKTSHHWRQYGQTLARIHRIKGTEFGLESPSYFGPLYQDNRPISDWPTFYAERRLRPWLKAAVDSGNMPSSAIKQVEMLISRLPDLCGPKVPPTLLHGDAQQNNFISTEKGTVVIDPAVYYGHPEIDLALIDYFQPVPDDVFDGYQEEMAIAPGFSERRDLWRVGAYLAAVTVEGGVHLTKLTDAVQKYL